MIKKQLNNFVLFFFFCIEVLKHYGNNPPIRTVERSQFFPFRHLLMKLQT